MAVTVLLPGRLHGQDEDGYMHPSNENGKSVSSASPDGVYWNTHSGRFIYPPAFDFAGRDGENQYRFTVRSLSDGAATVFLAADANASLAPVWSTLPPDSLLLLVEVLTHEGAEVPVAERRLIKSPGFREAEPGTGSRPVAADEEDGPGVFRQAGYQSLDSLYRSPRVQHWLEWGRPNPD